MNDKHYYFKCGTCGFEFDVWTNDTESLNELAECPCGSVCDITVIGESEEK